VGPATDSAEPTGWEHRIEQVTVTDRWNTYRQQERLEVFRDRLDAFGRYGWELVQYDVSRHAVPLEGSTSEAVTHLAVLKRRTGRAPIPQPAALDAGDDTDLAADAWVSAESRKALVDRWREACGPIPDDLGALLDAQAFLPEDDWSLIVPCRDHRVAESQQALLAVGSSWWIFVGFDGDSGRVRVGDVAALLGVSQDENSVLLDDAEGEREMLVFSSVRTAERTAVFLRARQAALSAD
jgi:hypothetical protein